MAYVFLTQLLNDFRFFSRNFNQDVCSRRCDWFCSERLSRYATPSNCVSINTNESPKWALRSVLLVGGAKFMLGASRCPISWRTPSICVHRKTWPVPSMRRWTGGRSRRAVAAGRGRKPAGVRRWWTAPLLDQWSDWNDFLVSLAVRRETLVWFGPLWLLSNCATLRFLQAENISRPPAGTGLSLVSWDSTRISDRVCAGSNRWWCFRLCARPERVANVFGNLPDVPNCLANGAFHQSNESGGRKERRIVCFSVVFFPTAPNVSRFNCGLIGRTYSKENEERSKVAQVDLWKSRKGIFPLSLSWSPCQSLYRSQLLFLPRDTADSIWRLSAAVLDH